MHQPFAIFERTALSLAGLTFRSQSPLAKLEGDARGQLAWVRSLGFRAVVLDGTAEQIRARNLDRTARRDLASHMRRNDLLFAGVDLFIPPTHISDPAHQDRAFAAIKESLTLASDLAALIAGSPPLVSILAPPSLSAKDIEALAQIADSSPSRLALIAWPVSDQLRTALASVPKLGLAFDPARVLAISADPAKELSRLKPAPASIRLNDFDGVGRVALGKGNLDFTQYIVAASVANFAVPLILDVGGLADAQAAIAAAISLAS